MICLEIRHISRPLVVMGNKPKYARGLNYQFPPRRHLHNYLFFPTAWKLFSLILGTNWYSERVIQRFIVLAQALHPTVVFRLWTVLQWVMTSSLWQSRLFTGTLSWRMWLTEELLNTVQQIVLTWLDEYTHSNYGLKQSSSFVIFPTHPWGI